MKDKVEHVVLDNATKKMKCNHCGETADMPGPLPLKVSTFTAMLNGFIEAHKKCKPQTNG